MFRVAVLKSTNRMHKKSGKVCVFFETDVAHNLLYAKLRVSLASTSRKLVHRRRHTQASELNLTIFETMRSLQNIHNSVRCRSLNK